jgi:hypothetical protein
MEAKIGSSKTAARVGLISPECPLIRRQVQQTIRSLGENPDAEADRPPLVATTSARTKIPTLLGGI